MTLESQIRETVAAAVRDALERNLPAHLARITQPADPEKCRSVADTAEYLGVTQSCVRERIKEGELETIRLGRYLLIPHSSVQKMVARQLDRKRFQRDQAPIEVVSDMDDEINEALGLSPAKKKARR